MTSDEESLHRQVLSLARQYNSLVYRIARRYADTPSDADDLTQEIWVRVIDILPRKNPSSPMEGWLCVVAVNVGYEHLKRRKRAARLREKLHFFSAPAHSHQEEARLEQSTFTRIWNAIDTLPALQRQVLLHRLFEGLSTEETARAIQRAEGTVKASLHRALKSLGAELADLELDWSRGEL